MTMTAVLRDRKFWGLQAAAFAALCGYFFVIVPAIRAAGWDDFAFRASFFDRAWGVFNGVLFAWIMRGP